MTDRTQPTMATPTPWEAQEFDPEEKCVPIIGLRAECPEGPTNGMVGCTTLFPTEMDAIDGSGPDRAIANAALIVEAVNSYAALKARIEHLEREARKAAEEIGWGEFDQARRRLKALEAKHD